jgi:hypothetical protein
MSPHAGPDPVPIQRLVKPLRAVALSLAFASPSATEEVAVPMADGSVLHGERVDDPAVAHRGLRIRTGGVTVFVPWEEMAQGARERFEAGKAPDAPLTSAPPAPGPGVPPPEARIEEAPPMPELPAHEPGEPPPMPPCCDPRL